ncbi:unnamed protein product [Aphanomyces euteiches]|uniref:Uncharacterized protein n=1 Tax=Aphanomyces euteiches TaxID=100861 RepID=A0A6G0XF94_9STRA|nr:hypothetical protein Ae201684_005311 [Aphanomyces euteiches]KAH9053563.1 hypothetical protein Ae201684P_015327 [Aphanomyces euteiches]KAH9132754.1 hypothetical protein AeRB84_020958 [Aphanomyces euteiches]
MTAVGVDGIEALFVGGRLTEALEKSREWLTNQLHLDVDMVAAKTNLPLLNKEIHITVDDNDALDEDIERVLAVYMQSTFELNAPDELLVLADVVRILSPVPYHIGLFWSSFLVAMDQKDEARTFLVRALQHLKDHINGVETTESHLYRRYDEMVNILLTKIWLPETTNSAILTKRIQDDAVLTAASKAKYIEQIQLYYQGTSVAVTEPSTSSSTQATTVKPVTTQDTSQNSSGSILSDPSTQLVLGAAAVAAVCAIKYRSHLHTSVNDLVSTLSDVKGLLFG